jgi:hypothetical protein
MPIDMKALARAGAEARVRELLDEVEEIRRAFPELREQQRGQKRVARSATEPARRKRPPMSAAQKRAVGQRMKAYWAKRRKDAAKAEKKSQG